MTTELLQATDDLSELARQACTCGHLPDVHDELGCWNCECSRVPSPYGAPLFCAHIGLRPEGDSRLESLESGRFSRQPR